MQKSFMRFTLGLFLLGGIASADMVVPASALPQNAQGFISSTFKDAQVMYVEQDYDSFEVRLSNGVKIDFYRDGNWKEIESYVGINPSILPPQIATTITSSYPNITIVKVEKEWASYEVKLANRLQLYINDAGQIIGQKYDD